MLSLARMNCFRDGQGILFAVSRNTALLSGWLKTEGEIKKLKVKRNKYSRLSIIRLPIIRTSP